MFSAAGAVVTAIRIIGVISIVAIIIAIILSARAVPRIFVSAVFVASVSSSIFNKLRMSEKFAMKA